jgi:hypothetical protein
MTTSNLPGNPHFSEANHDNGTENYNLAQAVLALAFEQRTANIIAALQPIRIAGTELLASREQATLQCSTVAKRLGL